jgi:hypothetical protein
MRVLSDRFLLLLLPWFFIGYWILKTGLDIYPGPFFYFIDLRSAGLWPALFSTRLLKMCPDIPGLRLSHHRS